MAFSNYVYESDAGVSFQIRLDSDQAAEAGGVAGVSDVPAHVRVSTSRREYGVQPRHIVAARLVGAAPNQFTKSTRLPICTPTAFAAIAVGSAIEINGISYTVRTKVAEGYR